MKINSESTMLAFGKEFGRQLFSHPSNLTNAPIIIELIGDVGTGKTTFTRGLASGLNIKEQITSPSFTISKSYAFLAPDGSPCALTHYDFYRLEDPGLMADDLSEKLTPKNLIVIEWGESIKNLLPKNHTIINFDLLDDGSREVTIS